MEFSGRGPVGVGGDSTGNPGEDCCLRSRTQRGEAAGLDATDWMVQEGGLGGGSAFGDGGHDDQLAESVNMSSTRGMFFFGGVSRGTRGSRGRRPALDGMLQPNQYLKSFGMAPVRAGLLSMLDVDVIGSTADVSSCTGLSRYSYSMLYDSENDKDVNRTSAVGLCVSSSTIANNYC
jgi:hypothetical protein